MILLEQVCGIGFAHSVQSLIPLLRFCSFYLLATFRVTSWICMNYFLTKGCMQNLLTCYFLTLYCWLPVWLGGHPCCLGNSQSHSLTISHVPPQTSSEVTSLGCFWESSAWHVLHLPSHQGWVWFYFWPWLLWAASGLSFLFFYYLSIGCFSVPGWKGGLGSFFKSAPHPAVIFLSRCRGWSLMGVTSCAQSVVPHEDASCYHPWFLSLDSLSFLFTFSCL